MVCVCDDVVCCIMCAEHLVYVKHLHQIPSYSRTVKCITETKTDFNSRSDGAEITIQIHTHTNMNMCTETPYTDGCLPCSGARFHLF